RRVLEPEPPNNEFPPEDGGDAAEVSPVPGLNQNMFALVKMPASRPDAACVRFKSSSKTSCAEAPRCLLSVSRSPSEPRNTTRQLIRQCKHVMPRPPDTWDNLEGIGQTVL